MKSSQLIVLKVNSFLLYPMSFVLVGYLWLGPTLLRGLTPNRQLMFGSH